MMEGKRFGIGLAAGVLLALALVAVSGGLGSTPLTASFGPAKSVSPASSTTLTTATVTMSATTTVPQTVTSAALTTSTTSGTPEASLTSNVTYPYSVSSSSTTLTSTVSSVTNTASNSSPGSQTATTNTNGTLYNMITPSGTGTNKPTRLASIAQQPIVSNAEVFAPVLVAFLLGAFLYRIVVQERERPSGTSP